MECPFCREKSLEESSDVDRVGTKRQLWIVILWPVWMYADMDPDPRICAFVVPSANVTCVVGSFHSENVLKIFLFVMREWDAPESISNLVNMSLKLELYRFIVTLE